MKKNNMINQEINKVLNRMKEINRISDKLNDNSLSLQEKLRLTTLKNEKVEELRKICKLHLEKSESESKSEIEPKTREEEIEWQKNQIERIKEAIEQCKKDKNFTLLNSMVILLERQEESLKFLEERNDKEVVVDDSFWKYNRDRFR